MNLKTAWNYQTDRQSHFHPIDRISEWRRSLY